MFRGFVPSRGYLEPMNINPVAFTKPALPVVPNNGRGRLEVSVTYDAPVTEQVELGRIPVDYVTFGSAGYTETVTYGPDSPKLTVNPNGESRAVMASRLVRGAEGLRWERRTVNLVAEPTSKLATASKWAALGALAGAVAGAAVGLVLGGAVMAAVVAGGAAAVAGAALGYRSASSDRVSLEWQARPIQNLELTGFVHRVNTSSFKGRTTQHHSHEPSLSRENLGWYYEPVVVHHKAGQKTAFGA